MWGLISICVAFWLKSDIPHFAERTNRQIYQDFSSLVHIDMSEHVFFTQSLLQPKQSKLGNLFFVLFPILMWLSPNPVIGLIFIVLCFLSLLDYCYYLTDIRYIVLIFLLVLWEGADNFYNDTLFFTILFCSSIAIFSQRIFKKEALGTGDMLLFIVLSPLFHLNKMLLLVLTACLLGIFYYLLYWRIKKQKLEKLPFIPFISTATLMVYLT